MNILFIFSNKIQNVFTVVLFIFVVVLTTWYYRLERKEAWIIAKSHSDWSSYRRRRDFHIICLNVWKVTHGPHVFPKQKFSELEDFRYDKFLQEEIKNTFGESIYQYLSDLSEGRIKLHHMPPNVLLRIIGYLGTNDVLRLSRTSKIFMELCNADGVWLSIFKKVLRRGPSPEEKRMAFESGWKETLKKRMAYIKKAFAESKHKKTPFVVTKKKLGKIK